MSSADRYLLGFALKNRATQLRAQADGYTERSVKVLAEARVLEEDEEACAAAKHPRQGLLCACGEKCYA